MRSGVSRRSSIPSRVDLVSLALLVLTGPGLAAWAQDAVQEGRRDVTDIDLDDLLKVHVTSASKKDQSLNDVAAAVTVLRDEDLRRMGVTTVAEAMRAVPGFHVGRNTSSVWAVSPRGFSDELSNKLLVMIDGRSVYSPLHSGVYWDVQDVFMEDVDRIEVVRGPGGTLWGANAVNGVVNIITKPAGETQGGLITAGGGTEERILSGARYGFKAADNVDVRVFAKYSEHDDALDGVTTNTRAYDGWNLAHGGFRADWKTGDSSRITFSGDYYEGQVKEQIQNAILTAQFSETLKNRMDVKGANALFRWEKSIDPASSLSVQMYYDYTFRDEAVFKDVLHTGDFDVQYRFNPFDCNDVILGAGYRIYRSVTDGSFAFNIVPPDHTDDVISAFLQDDMTLIKDRLHFTLGSKFEQNDYSGFEYQPSARLAWTPEEHHMVWTSLTRAVRTPSIIDVDGRLTPTVIGGGPVPIAVTITGNEEFQTETLRAAEMGYRVRPVDPLSLDLALFANHYDRIRTGSIGAPFVTADPPPIHAVVPVNLENDQHGQTRGVELAANLQAAAWWLVQLNYTYLHMNMNQGDTNRRSPHEQVWMRSAMDLPGNLQLDVMGRYVSGLPPFDLKSYVEAEVRLAWRDPSRRLEAAVVGQNLAHASHPEFDVASKRSEIQRGVYGSLTWRF